MNTLEKPRVSFESGTKRRKKAKRKKIIFNFLLLIIILVTAFSLDSVVKSKTFAKFTSNYFKSDKVKIEDINAALNEAVNAYPGTTFGVSYVNLDTGEKTDVNGDVNFTAASTGKVIPALLFLKKVEEGKFSLNQYFSDYSASFELKQMINRSNNESWALFNKILGISNEEKYANNIGIEYDGNDNILTANDYALVLSKLYKGELLNKEHTDLLLSYMKGTNEERLIPAALPKADVNHKYGMLGGYIHDGAIVNDGTNKYVLVIYSRNDKNQDPDLRASMFKKIADAINSKLNN